MKYLIIIIGLLLFQTSCLQKKHSEFLEWPEVNTSQTRPWTWWWWHGNAVNEKDISRILEEFKEQGFGGVNIVSILTVDDSLHRKIPYLSEEFVHMIQFATEKAHSLGMDLDVPPTSGWAFASPQTTRQEACSKAGVVMIPYTELKCVGDKLFSGYLKDSDFIYENVNHILAQSDENERVDITGRLEKSGILDWKPDATSKGWKIFIGYTKPGSSKARFPNPEWNSYVIDHLDTNAVKTWLSEIDEAYKSVPVTSLPRAYNNDSWEIGLSWSKNFYEKFKALRGYDLRNYLPEFAGYGDPDIIARVAHDYKETISDLMIDFTKLYTSWTHSRGGKSIGEVLSEPTNEVDANLFYDIPQADVGASKPIYMQDGDLSSYHIITRGKMPSSAVNIMGKPWLSSETFTCQGPVFDTSLEELKEKIDIDFICEVNQSCYHGVTYSPASARWPGWLFYAGTHLGSFNPLWRLEGKDFNDYVTRCQSMLQKGYVDSEVLVYFPYSDELSNRNAPENMPPRYVHLDVTMRIDDGFAGAEASHKLIRSGIPYDYVTDYIITDILKTKKGEIDAPGHSYKTLIVNDCKYIKLNTMKSLVSLVENGAKVIFMGEKPTDVPGLLEYQQKREELSSIYDAIDSKKEKVNDNISVSKIGKGEFIFGNELDALCDYAEIKREKMYDHDLRFTRRRDQDSWIYFITNLARGNRVDGWMPLAVKGESAIIYDPMTSETGVAKYNSKNSEIYLQLEPMQSCVVRVFDNMDFSDEDRKWCYTENLPEKRNVVGTWKVDFIDGGEQLPLSETIINTSEQPLLPSWTEWESSQECLLKGFSGIAKYTIELDTKEVFQDSDIYLLDLGELATVASVSLNGQKIAGFISKPFSVKIGKGQIADDKNILEIFVANTAINRIADLDKKGVDWYYKTSFMDLNSCSWEISKKDKNWIPVKSGLIGPVTITPQCKMN